ncbi:MAG: TetR/AcrR family transcriptional regulator [Bacteroidales bacterium]|nr:TetR/AcrR family transcriptional regulator [Bacteroidales bacterium]
MVKKTVSTEEKIIAAAKKVFILKGIDGARMQEIADEAGINKSLLHYYFRSKDKLFDRVFSDSFIPVVKTINLVFEKFQDIDSLVEGFVRHYITMLRENPYIPHFIIHELNRNPDRIVEQIQSSSVNLNRIMEIISKDVEGHKLRPFKPVHVLVNIVALCVFPFVARPIIQGFLLNDSETEFREFIEERTQHIISFVKSAIFVNQP